MKYQKTWTWLAGTLGPAALSVSTIALSACLQEPPADYTLPRDASASSDAALHRDGGSDAGLDARAAAP